MLIDCNLVHADFSEYNLLYHNKQIWVIDVSQSVEKDHPFSFEFLKRDIYNINKYYEKLGVNIFKFKSLFNIITDPKLTAEDVEQLIEEMKDEAMENPDTDKEINDFLLYEIPRTLSIYSEIEEINNKLEAIKNNLDTLIFGRFMGQDERILQGVIYEGEEGEVPEEDLLTDEEFNLLVQQENEAKKNKR
jgi:RIO kinase 1